MAFYNKDINSIFKELNSSASGLSETETKQNLEQFGSNAFEKPKHISFFKKLLLQFKNIMIIILLISAAISIITAITSGSHENLFEGLLILVIVLINAIVGVIQEQKAENALETLASSSLPFAKLIRNGMLQKIALEDVVVGDIVELKTGDYIPADIRIIECQNLKTNESSLTGESHSVSKISSTLFKSNLTISEQENMCFKGTTITSGHGTGIAVAVGKQTEMGKIAKILNKQVKEKTPLEKNIDRIGKTLTIAILLIVVVVFFVQVFVGKNITILNALLTAVALAVAAIPESLPAVITIIMALGVQKLARKNAIVKKLSAVETLGCCNIICSDKTGTLTKNQMSVSHIFYNLKIYGTDTNIDGNNPLFKCAALCNNARIDLSNEKQTNISADATETAIVKFLLKNNVDINQIKQENPRISETEFSSKTKLMSVECLEKNAKTLYFKGAIDYILPKCDKILLNNQIEPLTEKLKNKILNSNEIVCENGERVIGFAYQSQNLNNSSNENNLIFIGFFSIFDPPRKEVFKALETCKTAGLKTIIITGDHPATALSIAKTLGVAKSKKQVLTGSEINKLSETELKQIINKYSVFARVTPEHKLMIVKALKTNGNVVAMTGDGVNDAPSIKTANIGACMGITGTDVTKEVADIIISDDNFSTLVVAVKEGRTIYQNISKTILFLLSTNIVEVLGIFITSLVIPNAIFLLPVQILFINLVTDSLPAFALGIEPPEKNIMQKPPRNPHKSLLSGSIGSSIIYQGFIQTLIVLIMFVVARNIYGDQTASTMSFLTICFMQIVHAINCKTERSIFKTNIFKNKFFNISFIALFVLILTIYFVPFFASIFSLTTLNFTQWLIIGITSLSIIPLVELGKIFIR